MSQASWLRAISECLLNFGIPREILCDNDKSLVLSNDGPKKVRFHPDFLFFCKCTTYKEIDIAYQQLQPMHGLKPKLYQKLDTI